MIGGAALIAACVSSTSLTAPVLPTPFPEIATTPELEIWVTESILSFRETQQSDTFIGFGLKVLELSAGLESVDSQGSALVVTSTKPPAGWFATPLGKDSVVFVVNGEFPLRDLAAEQIVDIFTGRIDNWQSLGGPDLAIQAIVPLQGAETRSYLQQTLLGDRRFTSSAVLGPVPEAVLSLVQEDLGAIGFLPLSAVSGDVGLLSIDGRDPLEAPNYLFMFEVLGIAPDEPGWIVRDWLAWLQASD